MMTHNVAVAESYLDICRELGAAPCQPFLQCLQAGSRACKLPAFDQEEQLYAARTILPYAGLQELDLSGLQLSLTGWVALLESCSKSPQLKVLSLKGCGLGSIGEGFKTEYLSSWSMYTSAIVLPSNLPKRVCLQ